MPEESVRDIRTKYLHPLTQGALKRVVEYVTPSVEDYERRLRWRKRCLVILRLLLGSVVSWLLSFLLRKWSG